MKNAFIFIGGMVLGAVMMREHFRAELAEVVLKKAFEADKKDDE